MGAGRYEGLLGPGWQGWDLVEGSRERRPAGRALSFSVRSPGFLQGQEAMDRALQHLHLMQITLGYNMGLDWSQEPAGRKQGQVTKPAGRRGETGQHLVKGMVVKLMF